ncbi:MAG: sensor hybrid histidine kinase [Gemmatimonadetes bacterium]|nr:sensor hybrid histidine kinase [Gemmatimonadota bacterium]
MAGWPGESDHFRVLFDESPRGMFVSNGGGVIEDVNAAGCVIAGRRRDAIIGTCIADIPAKMESRALGSGMLLNTVRDVRRELANDLLHQQRQAVEAAPNPIAICDLTGVVKYVNPCFVRMWGYLRADEVVGRPAREFAESADETIASILAGRGLWSGEVKCVRKDGDSFFAMLSTSVTRNTCGKPTGMIGVFADITELRAAAEAWHVAEETLAFREDQLAQVVRVSQIGVFDHDHLTDAVYWSPVARELFDWDQHEVLSVENFIARVYPDDREALINAMQAAHDPAGDGVFNVKFRIVRDDGTLRWMESHARTFFSGGTARRTVGGSRDITANRNAEEDRARLLERLTQAEKMESVGRLAGGIAHDFNNMLAVILGYIELALVDLPADHPLQDDLQEAQSAARRSADLTRQLLAFARRQSIAPSVQRLDETVSSLLKMLHRLIGEDIHLAWQPQESTWLVNVDSSQVDQVLTNLTVNARDAVDGVGQVTIRTANIVADAAFVRRHPDAMVGEYVMLAVTDTGHGMDEETLAHIFEPFFTTKAPGQGTGLGLAMVYGIARQNNGFVAVESTRETGTTVAIYFPRHAEVLTERAPGESPLRVLGGVETLLVVEDEPQVLQLTVRMLRSFGYDVHAARGAADALRFVESHPGPIHLALLDMVMPELNGTELCQLLCGLRPDLTCMFVSGYPSTVSTNRGLLAKGTPYLQKPFSASDLARTVRAALDRTYMTTPSSIPVLAPSA